MLVMLPPTSPASIAAWIAARRLASSSFLEPLSMPALV